MPTTGTALRDLIRGVLALSGMTKSELARRSGLSPQAISTFLAARPMRDLPRPATIQGLAAGLGVPEADVVRACMQDVGLSEIAIESGDPALSVILAVARELDPDARARLAKIAQTFADY